MGRNAKRRDRGREHKEEALSIMDFGIFRF